MANLEKVNGPRTTTATYSESLNRLNDEARKVAAAMTGISSAARSADVGKIPASVTQATDALVAVADAAVYNAYLISASDASSNAGSAGRRRPEQAQNK